MLQLKALLRSVRELTMLVKSQPQSHHGLDAVAAKKFIAVLGVLTVVVPVLILPHMDDLCDVSDALCSGELA